MIYHLKIHHYDDHDDHFNNGHYSSLIIMMTMMTMMTMMMTMMTMEAVIVTCIQEATHKNEKVKGKLESKALHASARPVQALSFHTYPMLPRKPSFCPCDVTAWKFCKLRSDGSVSAGHVVAVSHKLSIAAGAGDLR